MIDKDRRDLGDFLNGKSRGAEALIGRYSQPLINHASYMLGGDVAMAEDMVQMTFLKLWQNAKTLLEREQKLQLRAWLYRVLRNHVLDEMRKNHGEYLDDDFDIADQKASADRAMEYEERARFAMGLIARLPERQKSALLMAHFEDMSNPEIAEIMDCSIEAVENLLARARRSLRGWAEERALAL